MPITALIYFAVAGQVVSVRRALSMPIARKIAQDIGQLRTVVGSRKSGPDDKRLKAGVRDTCTPHQPRLRGPTKALCRWRFARARSYQYLVLNTFYPGETLVVALLLAFVPYLLLRGPIERVARRWFARTEAD